MSPLKRITDGQVELGLGEKVAGAELPVLIVLGIRGPERDPHVQAQDEECEIEAKPHTGANGELPVESIHVEP